MSKNSLYWGFNIPLQVWPVREEADNPSKIVGTTILNYMPRKERCESVDLEELLGEQTREEFFNTAAEKLESLAAKMRLAAKDETFVVYYPD